MTKENKLLSLISLVSISVINLLHFFICFIPMFVEQIQIGEGTNIEIAAIILWLFEGLLFVLTVISFIIVLFSLSKHENKKIIITDFALIFVFIIQIILTNVFIFF